MPTPASQPSFSLADIPSLAGKVCAVTGGESGPGLEIVAQLLVHDIAKIYVLGCCADAFESAERFWRESRGFAAEDLQRRVEFLTCDLSDMLSVKEVGDALYRNVERLDILINNAEISNMKDYTLSLQGIETMWANNVVGHFILTQLLLPLLESTAARYGNARIINTTSFLHFGCEELKFDLTMSPTRVMSPDVNESLWRYARSKLGNILFNRELARRLAKKGADKVYANAFSPGNSPSHGMVSWKDVLTSAEDTFIEKKLDGTSQTPAEVTALYLATSPEVEINRQSGKYFVPVAAENKTSKLGEDKDLAINLWYWCDNKATKTLGKGWQECGGIEETIDTKSDVVSHSGT